MLHPEREQVAQVEQSAGVGGANVDGLGGHNARGRIPRLFSPGAIH
jgi:hypothetical protein